MVGVKVEEIKPEDYAGSVLLSGPPRCGTHWLRYIVSELIPDRKVRFHHTLKGNFGEQLILILRNPKESILRHLGSGIRLLGPSDYYNALNRAFKGDPKINDYVYPISFYDNFSKSKIVIYYEDLITNPGLNIEVIANFLKTSSLDFMSKYDEHKKKSIEKMEFPSVTKGDKVLYHSTYMPEPISVLFEEKINSLPENIKKYLKRYIGGSNG